MRFRNSNEGKGGKEATFYVGKKIWWLRHEHRLDMTSCYRRNHEAVPRAACRDQEIRETIKLVLS